MSGPVASSIILLDDAGNTGKKMRLQSRVVGGVTVYEHFFVPVREKEVINTYRFCLDQQTVLASAQNGTTAGFLFFHMGSAVSGKAARLRRLAVTSQHSTALATPTAPRLLLKRYTSAGALSGAAIPVQKNDSTKPAAASILSAVNTGNTVVHVASIGSAALAGALTAVGAYEPCFKDVIDPASEEDEWPIFYPGEGFVVYQDTAGTTSDTRKFNLQGLFDEIDTA